MKRILFLLGEDFDDSGEIAQNNGNVQVLKNGTLKFENASPENMGHYFCKVSNGIGNGLSKVVTVRIYGS